MRMLRNSSSLSILVILFAVACWPGYAKALDDGGGRSILADGAGNRALALGGAYAAVANDALFFPVNPGAEEASWKRLYEEGIERFLSGTFAGEYQEKLLAEFDGFLPEKPPWRTEE